MPAPRSQPTTDGRLRAAALYLRGQGYFDRGMFAQAASDLDRSIAFDVEFLPSFLLRGVARCRTARYEEAILDFRKATAGDGAMKSRNAPDFARALAQHGKTLYDRKEYHNSVAHFLEAIELDPESAKAHAPTLADALVYRGIDFQNAQNFEKAFADYDAAIRLRPEGYWAFRNRAMIYHRWKRYEEALEDCDEAIRLSPTFAAAYYQRAWVFIGREQYEAGAAEMSEAIRLKQDAEYYHDRGFCCRRLQQFDKAIEDLNEAIRIDCQRAWSFFQRGLAHRQKGDLRQAVADFGDAVRLLPREPEFLLERGRTLLKMHRLARGIADLDAASRIATRSPMTLNRLAWTWATWPHARVLDGKRALRTARKACKLTDWKDPAFLDTLAASYAQVGKFPQAMEMVPEGRREDYRSRLQRYEAKKAYREILA